MDFDKFVAKILKNDDIILPITEYFKLKEQAKQNADLKKLSKTKKKLKLDKYLPATKRNKYLLITEGASATGGLIGPLGREHCGFFELKGKPLNSYAQTQAKFTANKEMSELYQVIRNEDYEFIINATDQDLDGIHIRGLLIGMIERYLPEWKTKVGNLNTPVIGIKKNRKLVRWTYNLKETLTPKKGEESKYYKGIGSWNEKDLKHVIETDGLEKMIDMLEFDDPQAIEDWLGDKTADKRKEFIMANEFSITKL
jgi:DNA gyrase/topoisomerase IV subunit B